MRKKSVKKNRKSNALVHGVYASEFLLPWESEKVFCRLLDELRSYWKPGSYLESEAVLDIARLTWIKHRAIRMLQASYHKDQFTQDIVASNKKSWRGIIKYIKRQAKGGTVSRMHEMASDLIDSTRAFMDAADDKESSVDEIKNAQEQLSIRMNTAKELMLLIGELEKGPSAEKSFIHAYAPEHLEKCLAVEAAIDARLEKALGRLVSLQEHRRIEAGRERIPLLPQP